MKYASITSIMIILIMTQIGCTTASLDLGQCKSTCSKFGVIKATSSHSLDESSATCECRP